MPTNLTILIQGAEQVATALGEDKTKAASEILRRLTTTLYTKVVRFAPRRRGYLRKSIHPNELQPLLFTITQDLNVAPYGPLQRFGTVKKNYEIHPRAKRALWWPGLSHPIPWVGAPYTRLHPGIKGKDYVKSAISSGAHDIHAAKISLAALYSTLKPKVSRPKGETVVGPLHG